MLVSASALRLSLDTQTSVLYHPQLDERHLCPIGSDFKEVSLIS